MHVEELKGLHSSPQPDPPYSSFFFLFHLMESNLSVGMNLDNTHKSVHLGLTLPLTLTHTLTHHITYQQSHHEAQMCIPGQLRRRGSNQGTGVDSPHPP
jgi:hypothetical protein